MFLFSEVSTFHIEQQIHIKCHQSVLSSDWSSLKPAWSVYNVDVCSILCKKKNNGDMSRPTSLNSLCLSAPSHTGSFTQNFFQIDSIIAVALGNIFILTANFVTNTSFLRLKPIILNKTNVKTYLHYYCAPRDVLGVKRSKKKFL